MSTVKVWERGQDPPADLQSGDYILTFIGDSTLATTTAASLGLLRGKRVPYLGGHSLTINRVDLVRLGASQSLLSLSCTLEGFPWLGLFVCLTAAFVCLSLLTVERIIKSGPAGALTGILLAVVAVALVAGIAYFGLRSNKGAT